MSKSELIFIIDESGSMHPHTRKTVEGFNSLIHKQHYKENDCRHYYRLL